MMKKDLELNKRMAEIAGLPNHLSTCGKFVMVKPNLRRIEYNPVKNDALCHKYMIEYEVQPCYQSNTVTIYNNHGIVLSRVDFTDKTQINRAIIECIVESKNDQA